MATGGKARGRVALIHPRPAVAFFVNMEAVLSGRHPEILGVITMPAAPSAKNTVPSGASTPVALIELIVAVAVAAAAGVPAKTQLAANKLKIAFKKSRMRAPVPSSAPLLGGNLEFPS